MRVLILAEYYPRVADPSLGIWAHRQALAALESGADVRVVVLHRPVPPIASLRQLDFRAVRETIDQPRRATLDGLKIEYLRYLSPPRPWSYGSWGAWVAPVLRRALPRLHKAFPFELIHAHYAVPAGDAVRRVAPQMPLIVSVHGGDVYGAHAASETVRATFCHAQLVLANSAGTARRCLEHGALQTRVVHLGTDVPSEPHRQSSPPTLVSVGNLIARKRHADVISALPSLRERHPEIRYLVVGDGPEREPLRALAAQLGVERLVTLCGRLGHQDAVAVAQSGTLFVLPSVDEAFGVAYVEAMAGGVPAIGCRGEDGPEEIAAAGGGIALVQPRDVNGLAIQIEAMLNDDDAMERIGREARLTVQREFTWEKCGDETVEAYRAVLHR